MPLTKLTCPKCRAVLKPAKPVPEGKTIKCPKCEEMFKAGETAADARARAEAAKKKPAGAAAGKAAEEEEEEATYSVVRDEDLEKKAEEAERKKRKRIMKAKMKKRPTDPQEDEDEEVDEDDLAGQLLRNLKVRDPRGRAQEMVVTSSNALLASGLIGFFGWVATFVVFIIPVVFPNLPDTNDEEAQRIAQAEKAREDKERGKDKQRAPQKGLAEEIQERWWTVAIFIVMLLLGLAQAGIIAYGAVKMQGLESYRWALTSCIVTILPLYMVPLWTLLWYLFDWFMDDYPWAFAAIVYAWGPLVGGLCLKAFLNPKIKLGFEFKPD